MDLGLTDRVALVCGSSKGLGKATAKCLAQEGAAVVLCSSNPDNLEMARQDIQQVSGNEVTVIAANLSDQNDVGRLIDRLFEKFDHLDILVNNTGGPAPAQFEELDLAWHYYSFYLLHCAFLTMSGGICAIRVLSLPIAFPLWLQGYHFISKILISLSNNFCLFFFSISNPVFSVFVF